MQAVPETLTSGPGWHWDPGGWFQVDGPNVVIDGLDIHGAVDVCEECSGTVIQNSRVTADGSFGIIVRYSYKFGYGATGVTITDTEVRGGPQGNGAAITAQNGLPVTITRVNVHNTGTAIQLDRGSITDSYLWDLHVVPNGTHVNGITSNAGSGRRRAHDSPQHRVQLARSDRRHRAVPGLRGAIGRDDRQQPRRRRRLHDLRR